MKQINTLLRFFNTAYANKVRRVCEPLDQTFGIDAFWYCHISSSGAFNHMSNTPAGTTHYFENKSYLDNPFLRHPSNYREGFYLLSETLKGKALKLQEDHNQRFGLDNVLLLCKPEKDACQVFGFASSNKNLPILNTYFNNLPLLSRFADYFLQECSSFSLEPFQVDLTMLVGNSFNLRFPLQPTVDTDRREQFLKAMGLTGLSALTMREKDCLKHYLKGYTAQQTADLLHLSRRTVETHFENIKNKLGCFSKAEILQNLRNYYG